MLFKACVAMNDLQKSTTLATHDRYLSSSDAVKQVLQSPCVDRYGAKVLSRDKSKAVPCDRFGKPKDGKKRKNGQGGANGQGGGQDGAKNNKKKKNNNKVFFLFPHNDGGLKPREKTLELFLKILS